jgi:hypothetical protein
VSRALLGGFRIIRAAVQFRFNSRARSVNSISVIWSWKRNGWGPVVVAVLVAALGLWLARAVAPAGGMMLSGRLLLLGMGVIVAYVLLRVPPLAAVFGTLFFIAIVIFASHAAASGQRIATAWIILFIQAGLAVIWSVVFHVGQFMAVNRRLARALETYFPPLRAKQFTALRYRKLFEPGTTRQPVTMLAAKFPDASPGGGVALVRACIHATAGTVAHVEGLGAFAFWNAPEAQADHATRAGKAALRLRKRLAGAEKRAITIGLHTGVAVVGNRGSAERMEYGASGDGVEFTKELARLNTLLGTEVIVTGDTRRAMSDSFVTRYLGNFRLKHFVDAASVYELMGGDEVDETGRALRDSFDQAVYAFQGSDLQDAESSFRRVLEVYPDDLPTQFYLKRIEARAGEPVPYDWDGTIDLNEP